VSIPRARSDAQALSTIATYVNAWQAMNPGTYARNVGEGQAEPPRVRLSLAIACRTIVARLLGRNS
jgi:hypothetical protein